MYQAAGDLNKQTSPDEIFPFVLHYRYFNIITGRCEDSRFWGLCPPLGTQRNLWSWPAVPGASSGQFWRHKCTDFVVSAAKKDCVLYFYLAPLGVPPVFSVASLGESKAETNTCQIKVRDYDLLSLSLSLSQTWRTAKIITTIYQYFFPLSGFFKMTNVNIFL